MSNKIPAGCVKGLANPNLLLDPNFSINQSGADGDWTDTDYSIDLWVLCGSDVTGGTTTLATGKNERGYYMSVTHDSATNSSYILQRVEERLELQGKTLAFQIETSHGQAVSGSTLTLQWLTTDYGTASTVATATMGVEAGATTSKCTIDCPEISNYDSDNEYFLAVTYYYGGGMSASVADGEYVFEKVKLEDSESHTSIVLEDAWANLKACQRHFYVLIHPLRLYSTTTSTSDYTRQCDVVFPVRMRIAPSVDNIDSTAGAVTIGSPTKDGCRFTEERTSSAGGTTLETGITFDSRL